MFQIPLLVETGFTESVPFLLLMGKGINLPVPSLGAQGGLPRVPKRRPQREKGALAGEEALLLASQRLAPRSGYFANSVKRNYSAQSWLLFNSPY